MEKLIKLWEEKISALRDEKAKKIDESVIDAGKIQDVVRIQQDIDELTTEVSRAKELWNAIQRYS